MLFETINQEVVGVGGLHVSKDPEIVLKTHALGSCVAVIAYDTVSHISGMMHVALPDSSIDLEKGRLLPGYFADTGMAALLEALYKAGARRQNTWFKLAGGANVLNTSTNFDIGRRNVLALRKAFWKENLVIAAEDVGKNCSRSVSINAVTGEVVVSSQGVQWTL